MNEDKKGVTGIGGIFIKTKNPNEIKAWYRTHLGFDTDEYGTCFDGDKLTVARKKVLVNGALLVILPIILSLPKKIL